MAKSDMVTINTCLIVIKSGSQQQQSGHLSGKTSFWMAPCLKRVLDWT